MERQKIVSAQNAGLFLLILLGFLLRVCVALPGMKEPEKNFFRPDSSTYVEPARALWKTGRFNQSSESNTPATLRTPGYPSLLAILFALSGGSLKIPVIFFCLLSALTGFFVHGVCRHLGGGRSACLTAVLFFVLHLTSIALAPLYLADTALTFWIGAQLFFFTRHELSGKQSDLLWSIFFNALAVLTKPIAVTALLFCLFRVLFFSPGSLRRRFLKFAQCAGLALILLVPWMWRNQNAGAGFRLETNSANFYFHHGAALQSVLTGVSAQTWRDQWMRETDEIFQKHPEQYADEDARFRYKKEKLKTLIAEHPFTFLRLQIQPAILLPDAPTFFELLGVTTTGRGTLDILNRQGLLAAVRHYFGGKTGLLWAISPALLLVFVMTSGCFVQAGRWMRERKFTELCLFAGFVLFFLILPGPTVMPRYQLPALPLMAIMAGLAWETVFRRKNQKNAGPL